MKILKTDKSEHELFLENPENRRLYEQERLLVEVTESLTEAMGGKKISRAQLAQALGRSKAFVTQLLRGNHNMTLRTLADLFNAIDYEVHLNVVRRDGDWATKCDAIFRDAPAWRCAATFVGRGYQGTRRSQPRAVGRPSTRFGRLETSFSLSEVAA